MVRGDVPKCEEYRQPDSSPCGLCGFDFSKETVQNDPLSSRINMADLFHFVSGTYGEDELKNMNDYITDMNKNRKKQASEL